MNWSTSSCKETLWRVKRQVLLGSAEIASMSGTDLLPTTQKASLVGADARGWAYLCHCNASLYMEQLGLGTGIEEEGVGAEGEGAISAIGVVRLIM